VLVAEIGLATLSLLTLRLATGDRA